MEGLIFDSAKVVFPANIVLFQGLEKYPSDASVLVIFLEDAKNFPAAFVRDGRELEVNGSTIQRSFPNRVAQLLISFLSLAEV